MSTPLPKGGCLSWCVVAAEMACRLQCRAVQGLPAMKPLPPCGETGELSGCGRVGPMGELRAVRRPRGITVGERGRSFGCRHRAAHLRATLGLNAPILPTLYIRRNSATVKNRTNTDPRGEVPCVDLWPPSHHPLNSTHRCNPPPSSRLRGSGAEPRPPPSRCFYSAHC
jgi:hypothetical protein